MRITPALLALTLAASRPALADTPTDELMALVPADAAVVLVIDQFRERSREVLSSELIARLKELPAVRAWLKSDRANELRKARADVETGLGMTLERLRDDLLGDCVVLALSIPGGGSADDASGILLCRVRDRAALETLIAAMNKSETDEGRLKSVVELPRDAAAPSIHHRMFKPGTKPDEWYAILPGDTFVWSNSERLLRGVVERRPGGGFGGSVRYRSIRDRLPEKALARLYVDPRVVVATASAGKAPPDPQLAAVLNSADFVAAALEWREGPLIHLVETLDRDKLPPAFQPPIRSGPLDPLDLRRAPDASIVVAAWRWNLASTYDALLGLVPADERPRLETMLAILQGLLMGKDLRREVLPALGPGGLASVQPRDGSVVPEFVATFDLRDRKDVGDAIANALRTVVSLSSLDMNRKNVAVHLEDDDRDGVRVTRVVGGPNLAFAASPRRVAIGSEAAAVRRAMASPDSERERREARPIERLRDDHFARESGFVAIDVVALAEFATLHRDVLVRREAESKSRSEAQVKADFQKLLDLLGAFRGAFVAWGSSDDGRSFHQVIGLVGRDGAKPR